jgi:hypothetical protein
VRLLRSSGQARNDRPDLETAGTSMKSDPTIRSTESYRYVEHAAVFSVGYAYRF